MAIIRTVKGEYNTTVEQSWTVYTHDFIAQAGLHTDFTADEGIVFGQPEEDTVLEEIDLVFVPTTIAIDK
ncbi:hypothetical protein HX004_06160 [Myroides sp. 1354]|uniref:hypothetical protein n=1 Tax=unclassified Myroides TaxID=2642485 RepID=UPI0025752B07|nr:MULTISPECIES: hypothetical protein [unclassified Myroides]MDM1044644.1 hypothetical protein [Myroides sp. R163-1]MDM1055357.1 hypothetical protein [Myroides sp. 1354]MDM1068654.1 hypothetical protein [Myroides sp. 1372]